MNHAEKLNATYQSQVHDALLAMMKQAGVDRTALKLIETHVDRSMVGSISGVSIFTAASTNQIRTSSIHISPGPVADTLVGHEDGAYGQQMLRPFSLLQRFCQNRGVEFKIIDKIPQPGAVQNYGHAYLRADGAKAEQHIALTINDTLRELGIEGKDVTIFTRGTARAA